MTERRQFPRIKRSLPVKLSDTESDILTETKDISASGAYCSVNRPIEVMTKLGIVLLVPLKKNKKKIIKKITCEGVVVRKEYIRDNGKHSYHLGIFFNNMSDKDRKTLLAYMHSSSHQIINA